MLGTVPQALSTLLESESLTGLELANEAKMAGQRPQESAYLCFSSAWITCVPFFVGSRDRTRVLWLTCQALTN